MPDLVGLFITGGFGLAIAIVGALMAARGRKLGNRETRAPDVQELWAQQELDRRARQHAEDLWWNLRRAFQSYFRRVIVAVDTMDLAPAARKLFDLTTSERRAIDAQMPTDEPTTTKES